LADYENAFWGEWNGTPIDRTSKIKTTEDLPLRDNWTEIAECWEFYNDMMWDTIGKHAKNSYNSKIDLANVHWIQNIMDWNIRAWDAFVSDVLVINGEVDNWHIWIVESVNHKDRTVVLVDVNHLWKHEFNRRTVRFDRLGAAQENITGLIRPTSGERPPLWKLIEKRMLLDWIPNGTPAQQEAFLKLQTKKYGELTGKIWDAGKKSLNAYMTMKNEEKNFNSLYDSFKNLSPEEKKENWDKLTSLLNAITSKISNVQSDSEWNIKVEVWSNLINSAMKKTKIEWTPVQTMFSSIQRWAEAALRDESGAAIKAEEFAMKSKNWFPSYDDNAETRQDKRDARWIAIRWKWDTMPDRARYEYSITEWPWEYAWNYLYPEANQWENHEFVWDNLVEADNFYELQEEKERNQQQSGDINFQAINDRLLNTTSPNTQNKPVQPKEEPKSIVNNEDVFKWNPYSATQHKIAQDINKWKDEEERQAIWKRLEAELRKKWFDTSKFSFDWWI